GLGRRQEPPELEQHARAIEAGRLAEQLLQRLAGDGGVAERRRQLELLALGDELRLRLDRGDVEQPRRQRELLRRRRGLRCASRGVPAPPPRYSSRRASSTASGSWGASLSARRARSSAAASSPSVEATRAASSRIAARRSAGSRDEAAS